MGAACSSKAKKEQKTTSSPNIQGLSKSYSEFVSLLNEKKAEIIDIKTDITKGIIKNSYHINTSVTGTMESFKIIFPNLVPAETALLLVIEPSRTEEFLNILKEHGYTNILGYLEGGYETWVKNKGETTAVSSIKPEKLQEMIDTRQDEIVVLDIRGKQEFENKGNYPKAVFSTLKELEKDLKSGRLDEYKNSEVYLFCQLGLYRCGLGVSVLKKYGFINVSFIEGGMKNMIEVGIAQSPDKINK